MSGVLNPLSSLLHRSIAEGWSDERIGFAFLAARIAAEAENRGLSPHEVPEETARAWIQLFADQEVSRASSVAIEKVFRLAAQGNVARAGALLRDHMLSGAAGLADADLANKRRSASARQGMKSGKGLAKAKAARSKLPPDVAAEVARHVANGRSEKDAKSIIRARYGVTSQGLGKALKKHRPAR